MAGVFSMTTLQKLLDVNLWQTLRRRFRMA